MTAPTTFDMVALQLAAAKPEGLYRQADLFDHAAQVLGDIAERFRAVMRQVEESWLHRDTAGAPAPFDATSARVLNVLRELQSDDSGNLLRRAGDSLARANAEIHDLHLQRVQDPLAAAAPTPSAPNRYDAQAWLVLERVTRDFVEAGTGLPGLPDRTASGGTLTLGAGAPAPTMSLASATVLAEDPSKTQTPDLTGGPAPLSSSSALSATSPFDPTNPSSPPGGQPMMPFMPMGMGMGMGMGAQPTARERHTDPHATADPGTWHEANDGWEVLGRRPPPPPPAQAERAALDALDDLVRRRGLVNY